jgi:hypothetical protein
MHTTTRRDWVWAKVLGGWYGKRIAIALAAAAACLAGCDATPPLEPDGTTGAATNVTQVTGGPTQRPADTTPPAQPADAPSVTRPDVDERISCAPMAPADPTIVSSTTSTPGCPCTRRPGSGHSFECAVGAGESASATIGPEGGTLSLVGQQGKSSGVAFQIEFPPGAVPTPMTITVTETTVPPPGDLVDYSPVYLVEPRGLGLGKLSPVRVPWGSTSGPVAQDLAIYARAESAGGCAFTPLGDNDLNAGFNQGSIDHLGYLVVGAKRTDAEASCP